MRNLFQKFLLLTVSSALTAGPAHANCEAGAYTIHTVAEYKKPQPERIYLIYRISAQGKLEAKLTAIDKPSIMEGAKAGKPVWVRFGEAEWCQLKAGWQLDPAYSPDNPYSSEYPYRLDLSLCKTLLGSFAKEGYLIFNSPKMAVTFPKALPIRGEPLDSVPATARAEAVKDARSRELYLFAQPDWSGKSAVAPKSRIQPPMISADNLQAAAIGEGTSVFRLLVVSLRLKDVVKAYPASLIPASLQASPTAPVEYPVIYFVHPKVGKPVFIGDGADCSNARFEEGQADGIRSFDRFRATHAFDYDLDGIVDVLEINGRFAYELGPGKPPLVISYGQGC